MEDAPVIVEAPGAPLAPDMRASTSRIPRSECVTIFQPLTLTQLWRLENFATIMKLSRPGQCFRSQVFRDNSPGHPEVCWQLCLYPNGKREENKDNVSLFLKMSAITNNKEVLVKAEYRFYFLDENQTPRFSNVNIGDFHAKPPKGGHSWGLRNIPKPKVANAIRADGSLVISCIIEMIPDSSRIQCRRVLCVPAVKTVDVSERHLEEELDLLKTGDGSDFTIVSSDGERIPVHSWKLVAHSPVFRAMLAHKNTTESTERVLSIDVDSRILHVLLEFMYAGRFKNRVEWRKLMDVLVVSEKYDIADLKTFCEAHLISLTNYDNVCNVLPFAEMHNSENIVNHCLEVIHTHKSSIVRTPQWIEFRAKHASLCAYVLERLIDCPSTPPLKRLRVSEPDGEFDAVPPPTALL